MTNFAPYGQCVNVLWPQCPMNNELYQSSLAYVRIRLAKKQSDSDNKSRNDCFQHHQAKGLERNNPSNKPA